MKTVAVAASPPCRSTSITELTTRSAHEHVAARRLGERGAPRAQCPAEGAALGAGFAEADAGAAGAEAAGAADAAGAPDAAAAADALPAAAGAGAGAAAAGAAALALALALAGAAGPTAFAVPMNECRSSLLAA